MGIVNASPESFSDGGLYSSVETQVRAALEQVAAGAALVDVGGESGVTNAAPLMPDEEIGRVVPLVRALVDEGVIVSVDTWKPAVASAVLEAGAHLINDVSGLRDVGLASVCAAHGAGLVLMHTRAEPKHKDFPPYDDVVADVRSFLWERVEVALSNGVKRESLVIDPGPDFAKTPAQTVTVLRHLEGLREFGLPILAAVSRKDFVGALTERRPKNRLAGTLAAVGYGVAHGASLLRVHDVAEVADYLTVRAALEGDAPVPEDLMLDVSLRREPTVTS
ncbi:MAG: dihydropteroate synthase [Actinobacteria bacterium]|nr:dihydropteroate synthase [Actinomycetota bacterium]